MVQVRREIHLPWLTIIQISFFFCSSRRRHRRYWRDWSSDVCSSDLVGTPVFVRTTTALSRPALPADVRRAFAAPCRSPARRRSVGDFVADIPFSPGHPSRPVQEAIAEGIRGLDVPALLLWGPRDPAFGERYLTELRSRLPQARLHRYEGASHLLPEDAPQYAQAVAQWVADLDARVRTPARPATAGRRLRSEERRVGKEW